MNAYKQIYHNRFQNSRTVFAVLCLLIIQNARTQDNGTILLEKTIVEPEVIVTATQQVVLKSGFTASATNGTFNAKIGSRNVLIPTIETAAGSTTAITTSPSNDQNYIKTTRYLSSDERSKQITIQYFDGLGRPEQVVVQQNTPSKADLATFTKYDTMGREWKNWLPTPVEDNYGMFVDELTLTNKASVHYGDSYPYNETIYEPSPLNRVEQQFGPGQAWKNNNKRVTTEYLTNDGSVAYYFVNGTNNLERGTNYDQNTLYKTMVKDEDGKSTTEYKDKLGQVVLKQSIDDTGDEVNTYYVYNDLGQLSYVIPPLAADILGTGTYGDDNETLKQYCYLYKYDARGNCIQKRLPGCDWIYMIYDKADRLILSQDGNQREKNQWTFNKYDELGRLIITGIYHTEQNQSDLTQKCEDIVVSETYNSGYYGYSWDKLSEIPYTGTLIVNYYDDYDRIEQHSGISSMLRYEGKEGYDSRYINLNLGQKSAKGLLVGTRTKILDGSGEIITAMYYDYQGRVVQTRSTNHLGGFDIKYNAYGFTGNITKSLSEHSINPTHTNPLLETYTYAYDHALRPTTTTYTLNNNDPVVLASNTYDELGRLKEKKRHNATDTEQFQYNIRNWTTKITSGQFTEELLYNTNNNYNNITPCYNGNISAVTWIYNGVKKAYTYTYDKLNRLKLGNAYQVSGYTLYAPNNKEEFDYDKQGNIQRLWRQKDYTYVDFLQLYYNGNQLDYINDSGTNQDSYYVKEYQNKSAAASNEFSYDANGNMTKDLDRDIYTIKYNILNLPEIIQFKDGHQIINAYDAGGQKLSSRYYTILVKAEVPAINTLEPGQILNLQYNMDIIDETGTFYVDNKEYSFNGCDPGWYWVDKVYNSEGYTNNLGGYYGPNYQYYRKDHLGNNREVWRANTNQTIQKTQYYPSGLLWARNSSDDTELPLYANNRKYNGKEFVEMHGYDATDLGWRSIHNAKFRFDSFDPDAELDYDISPYAACHNNPVMKIDPNGRWVETVWDAYSLATGIESFIDNVKEGNVGAAILDGIGVVADGAAVILPVVPGGAGVGIKAFRAGEKAVETAKTVLSTNKTFGKAGEAIVTKTIKNEVGDGKKVLEQVTGKFADGKTTRFDNVIVDKKTGKVTMVNETKTGNAKHTKSQERYHKNGETVTFTGKKAKAEGIAGQKANTRMTESRTTRIKREDIEP